MGVFSGLRMKYRYIPYAFIVLLMFFEQLLKFGPVTAMIGGMVKKNCSDPTDTGKFCWSEQVQALVIGAFFYGFMFQFLIVTVAGRVGFTVTVRFTLLYSVVANGLYPLMARVSPYFVVVTQIIRALLVGSIIAYQFELTRKWSLPSERNYLLSFGGAMALFGLGFGSFMAGIVSKTWGWEYYFYIAAVLFFILYVTNIILVPETPQLSQLISKEELALYPTSNEDEKKRAGSEYTCWSTLLKRLYPWALSLGAVSFNSINYNLFTTIPIYLDKVYNISTEVLSFSTMGFGLTVGISMLVLSKVFQTVDKKVTWIKSRMMFTLTPFVIAIIVFLIIPSVNELWLVITLLIIVALGLGTLFSGSIITINYDVDPVNSSRINSIINSFAQIPGFIWPLIQVAMTETDPKTPDYDRVLRKKWNTYFYVLGCAPMLGIVAIVGSYLLKPSEWRLHPSLDKSKIVVNLAATGGTEKTNTDTNHVQTHDDLHVIGNQVAD